MGEACVRPDCSGGVIDEDGYCTECGLAPLSATTGRAGAPAATATAGPGARCARAGCAGTIDADGFCDECGLAPEGGAAIPSARQSPDSSSVRSMPSSRTGSARAMSGRSRSHRSTRTGTRGSVSVRSSKSTGTTAGRPGWAPAW